MKIVRFIESHMPASWVNWWRFNKLYIAKQIQYDRKLKQLRKVKRPINVLFFAVYESSWKFESVYRLMEQDPMFMPLVLVCPVVNQGEEYKHRNMSECFQYFQSHGYNTLMAYDGAIDTYIDAHDLNPDIIFYTNPYMTLIDNRYYIHQFKNVLTCYANYAYNNVLSRFMCGLDFHQLLWRYYLENTDNLALVKNFYNAHNCKVTGYPMIDSFMNHKVQSWPWKLKDKQFKRVIWAPHHTIEGNTDDTALSTFLQYSETMLTIAEQYKDRIQFAFKPHPLLIRALYKHPEWGKERTDSYYKKWAEEDNTTLVRGEYVDLFCTSDAMIHDCGSFIIEYMYVNKPVMILTDGDRLAQCNVTATNAYKCHYEGKNEDDILHFIERTVLHGEDPKINMRNAFYEKYLLPPYGESVAQNIINDIKDNLSKH